MYPLAYLAILAGAVLLTAGLTASTVPSVAQGKPDRAHTPSSSTATPAGGGGGATSTATPGHGFDGIIAAGERVLEYSRRDQGRDIRLRPGAALLANGDYEILRVGSDPSGFGPAYPVIRYITGPWAGRDVYYGHTITRLRAGARGHAGDVISHTSTTGINAPPGWAEIGFAPGGTPGPFGQPVPF